jgi:phosphatidylcholine synthase
MDHDRAQDAIVAENEIPLNRRLYGAWSIHSFTASGVICALFGFVAIFNHHPRSALVWLLVAQIIDGVDGPLARGLDVSKYVPVIDGNVLDLIIDYLTCVVVPVIFMLEFEIFPRRIEVGIAGLILFTSVLWFARRDIETKDNWFRGFPTGWNLVATSLWLLNFSQWTNTIIAAIFVALTMSNVKFFHILRSPQFRKVTISLTAVFLIDMTVMVLAPIDHHHAFGKSIIITWMIYYFAMSIWRSMQGDELSVEVLRTLDLHPIEQRGQHPLDD